MSLIKETPFEIVNENELVFDFNRDVLGANGANFDYTKYYWIVFLYHKEGDDSSATALDGDGSVKENYIEITQGEFSASKFYKIGFATLISSLKRVHSYADCYFYFSLAPFSTFVKFNKKSKAIANGAGTSEYKSPILGHFHQSASTENYKENNPFKTEFIVDEATSSFKNIDYFKSYGISGASLNPGSILIENENIGLTGPNYSLTGGSVFNQRSFQTDLTHKSKGKLAEYYYPVVDETFWDKIQFPIFDNNIVSLVLNTTRKIGKPLEVGVIVKGNDVKIDWGDGTVVQYDSYTEETEIKYTYTEDLKYAIVKLYNISYIALGENSYLGKVGINIKGCLFNSTTLTDYDLTDSNVNYTIERLYVYNTGAFSKPFKLSYFRELEIFQDKNPYSSTGGFANFIKNEGNPYFADNLANDILDYKQVYLENLNDATSLLEGWKKARDLSFYGSYNKIKSYDKMLSNCINLASFEIVGSSSGTSVQKTFTSTFEEDTALTSIKIPNITNIRDFTNMAKNCVNLTSVKIGSSTIPSNYVNLTTIGSECVADGMFQGTSSLESLDFNIYPVSMVDTFNGSGLNEFEYSSSGNVKCKDFTRCFANMPNIESLILDLGSASKIEDLLYNTTKFTRLELKNINTPLSLDTVANKEDNNESDFAIAMTEYKGMSEDDLSISIKSYPDNFNSPALITGSFTPNFINNVIIKGLKDVDSDTRRIIDCSRKLEDSSGEEISKGLESKGWIYYNNEAINRYAYLNFSLEKARSSINWYTFYFSSNYPDIVLIGDQDNNKMYLNGGGNSYYYLKIKNLPNPEEKYYGAKVVKSDDLSRVSINNLIPNDSEKYDNFTKSIVNLGAVDMESVGLYNSDKTNIVEFYIQPQRSKSFTVYFILNISPENHNGESATLKYIANESSDMEFSYTTDNRIPKFEWEEDSIIGNSSFDNEVSISDKRKIIAVNLKSTSPSAIGKITIEGNFVLNGLVFADTVDCRSVLV